MGQAVVSSLAGRQAVGVHLREEAQHVGEGEVPDGQFHLQRQRLAARSEEECPPVGPGRGLVQHVNGLERRRARSGAALEGALIQVRINNLDEVGSSYGPQWSDELLQFVASTISTSIRRDDIVARTGPATFDVLLVGASELAANQVCTRLTKALVSAHFSADGKAVDLALSVGGVLFEGNIDLERLRRTASSEAVTVAAEQAPAVALVRLPAA